MKRSPYEGGSVSVANVVSLRNAGGDGTIISMTKHGNVLIIPRSTKRAEKWRGHAKQS